MSLTDTRRILSPLSLAALSRALARLSGWRRAVVAFTLGAASVLAFAPFHLWPLLFLILPCFIWLMDGVAQSAPPGRRRWRAGAIAGWWFGFGFFAAGLYWIGYSFFVEADKFAWLVPLAVLAFPAAMALFYAAAGALATAVWRPGAARVFILVPAFFAADWLRGHIFTGFPWNLWGYAIAGNDALAQTASIFGIYSLTLIALVMFMSPAALAGSTLPGARSWPLPALCLVLLAGGWIWGTVRLAGATNDVRPEVQLRIVQPNIPQADKWKPENRQWIFDRLLELSRKPREGEAGSGGRKTTHLIWPESSVPFLFLLNDFMPYPDAKQAFAGLTRDGATLILGAERVEGTRRDDGRYNIDRVFNSLFVLDGEAHVASIYDKVHLVPFGEYLPLEETLTALGIKQLTNRDSGFASGTTRPLMTAAGAPPFIPLICYEVIFPTGISANGRPGWLLNLTNDSWFGDSTGPYQHLHQARLRAIEQGLPLIRAANTGISAVIDAHGRTVATLPLNTAGTIDHALPVAIGPTVYARWGENCLLFVAFLIFLLYRFIAQVECS